MTIGKHFVSKVLLSLVKLFSDVGLYGLCEIQTVLLVKLGDTSRDVCT